MGVSIPSAEEYEDQKGEGFTLLPADDYIVEVKQVNIQKDKQDIFNEDRRFDQLEVRFRVVSFANGDALLDEDGEDVNDERLFFDWLDPSRVGLLPQPAKARKFFAYATGVGLEDRIDINDFQDLVGKRLLAVAIIKPNKKGERKNKILDYRPIRVSRRKAAGAVASEAAPEQVAAAKIAPETKAAVAAEFEDDLPF